MGIEHFNHFLRTLNSEVAIKPNVNHLLIDGNPKLYNAFASYVTEKGMPLAHSDEKTEQRIYLYNIPGSDPTTHITDEIIRHTLNHFMTDINAMAPRDSVTICMDGFPCDGKIWNQKFRRFKPTCIKQEDSLVFSTALFSPGTPFMEKLDRELAKLPDIYPHLNFTFSSSAVYGEGEHKLIHELKMLNNESDTYMIICNDSDIYILAGVSMVRNVYVYNEFVNKFGVKQENIKSIDAMKATLGRIMRQPNVDIAIVDFMVISFFFGNDFLPFVRCLFDFVHCMNIVLREVYDPDYSFILNGRILRENIHNFIYRMMKREADLAYMVKAQSGFNIGIRDDSSGKLDYKRYLADYSAHVSSIYKPGEQVTSELDREMSEMYIQTLIWNIKYYLGSVIDCEMYYGFMHAPTFNSLCKYFESSYDESVSLTITPKDRNFYDTHECFREVQLGIVMNKLDRTTFWKEGHLVRKIGKYVDEQVKSAPVPDMRCRRRHEGLFIEVMQDPNIADVMADMVEQYGIAPTNAATIRYHKNTRKSDVEMVSKTFIMKKELVL